ncbi:hypothetical protein Tsubulata_019969 [Turnera subulata]|uniref:Phytocyanin domain-containing protein n=1 Tax=Turnera subulata TaxID=218843 RepID=A0A9Q0GK46_9ROSI|nr:hypothetical protein Tsubulata_019969 [Turnera subulata]
MAMLRTVMSLAVAAMILELAMAANYIVGGENGAWDATTDLQSWAGAQSFLVGDTLTFQYTPNHDVLEVSQADHDSCQTSSPLQTYTGGSAVIPLSSPGKRYFICGTPGHCSAGMKLEIDTLATITPTPASPITPPPTESPLIPAPDVIPPASSPLPENSIPSPAESPELTPGFPSSPPTPLLTSPGPASFPSSFSPVSLPLPATSSSATKYSFQISLTTGFSLIIMMLLAF